MANSLVKITVNVATLKEKLSYYLGLVREGQEIVVTSHRHRVARILPPLAPDARVTGPSPPVKDLRNIAKPSNLFLADLTREILRGKGPCSWLVFVLIRKYGTEGPRSV